MINDINNTRYPTLTSRSRHGSTTLDVYYSRKAQFLIIFVPSAIINFRVQCWRADQWLIS